jgi:mono/diheme cytochrome c family protein
VPRGARGGGRGSPDPAGGRPLASDFGTFIAPNISPDPTHGIGDWTLAEFVTAMQNGISPEGRHYYPAFPYTAYRLATRQDMADLFAFLRTLPASDTPSQPHQVGFPVTITRGIGLWNRLNLHDDFTVGGDLTEEETRGRYLAEALAHCAECHTPRDATGGLDRERWMTGAPNPSGQGTIPGLTPDDLTWSPRKSPPISTTASRRISTWRAGIWRTWCSTSPTSTPEDRLAIAAYIKALPPAD